MRIRRLAPAALAVGFTAELYRLTVTGGLTVDTGWGRTRRQLGPFGVDIAADSGVVFDVIAGPYLRRTPRAMADKLMVLERGSDMVLAEHYTRVWPGMLATTLETVRFTRPDRIDFRLVRGPVPYLVEQFVLSDTAGGARLDYGGELCADGWAAGRWWGERVGTAWETAVRHSFAGIKTEAERRASSH